MKTDCFHSALELCIFRKAFLSKRFLWVCFKLNLHIILLLWILDLWPLVDCGRVWLLKIQWELPFTREMNNKLAVWKRSFLLWPLGAILLPLQVESVWFIIILSLWLHCSLSLPPSLASILHLGLSIWSAVWTNACMLHILCMTQHQCWTTDQWIFADVRNIQNVPHCFTTGLLSRKSIQYVAWQLLSFLLSCGWHIASSPKSVSRLSTAIVPLGLHSMSGSRKEKGECHLLTAMVWLLQDWDWWLPPDVVCFVEQQMCLYTWEGSAEDWVEAPNLRANYAT